MAYIGNPLSANFVSIPRQSITGNGGSSYTLTNSVTNENELEVFVNNVRQEPGVAYTASGTALTMTGNVQSTDSFYVVYQGRALATVEPPANSVGSAEIINGSVSGANLATGAAATNLGSSVNLATIKDSSGSNTAMTIDSNGDLTFNGSNTASVSDSGWITATLLNNYTHYNTTSYGPIRYRKIGSIVNIQGLTTQATASSAIFNLPVGYRPPNHLILWVSNSNNLARLDIKLNGDVVPVTAPSTSWVSVFCTFMVA